MYQFFVPFLIGLAGSLHCVGMCGPLLMMVPMQHRRSPFVGWLQYHGARVSVYILMGILFGILGKGVALAGFQRLLSLAAGGILVIVALFAWRWERWTQQLPGLAHLQVWVKRELSRRMGQGQSVPLFLLGGLNGLLPCGMVYAALAGAIAAGDMLAGAVFMLLFGAGTVPLLLLLFYVGRPLQAVLRERLRLLQPLLLLIAAALLLMRGLHLDTSLFESAVPPADLDCH